MYGKSGCGMSGKIGMKTRLESDVVYILEEWK